MSGPFLESTDTPTPLSSVPLPLSTSQTSDSVVSEVGPPYPSGPTVTSTSHCTGLVTIFHRDPTSATHIWSHPSHPSSLRLPTTITMCTIPFLRRRWLHHLYPYFSGDLNDPKEGPLRRVPTSPRRKGECVRPVLPSVSNLVITTSLRVKYGLTRSVLVTCCLFVEGHLDLRSSSPVCIV